MPNRRLTNMDYALANPCRVLVVGGCGASKTTGSSRLRTKTRTKRTAKQQIDSDIEEIKELSGLQRLSKNYGSTEYDQVAYSVDPSDPRCIGVDTYDVGRKVRAYIVSEPENAVHPMNITSDTSFGRSECDTIEMKSHTLCRLCAMHAPPPRPQCTTAAHYGERNYRSRQPINCRSY